MGKIQSQIGMNADGNESSLDMVNLQNTELEGHAEEKILLNSDFTIAVASADSYTEFPVLCDTNREIQSQIFSKQSENVESQWLSPCYINSEPQYVLTNVETQSVVNYSSNNSSTFTELRPSTYVSTYDAYCLPVPQAVPYVPTTIFGGCRSSDTNFKNQSTLRLRRSNKERTVSSHRTIRDRGE